MEAVLRQYRSQFGNGRLGAESEKTERPDHQNHRPDPPAEKDGKGGRIVNIGSTSSHAGQPFIAPYCASKAALSTLTRSSGYALMRNRVHVNQLNIGWMASDHERQLQLEESGDPDWEAKANAGLPFGRLLDPEEVARAVLFLGSDDAGMMTGSVIHYDQSVWGGYDGQAPGPAEKLKE